jgi:hypothetical protein
MTTICQQQIEKCKKNQQSFFTLLNLEEENIGQLFEKSIKKACNSNYQRAIIE